MRSLGAVEGNRNDFLQLGRHPRYVGECLALFRCVELGLSRATQNDCVCLCCADRVRFWAIPYQGESLHRVDGVGKRGTFFLCGQQVADDLGEGLMEILDLIGRVSGVDPVHCVAIGINPDREI